MPLLPLDCAADAAAVTESGLHDDRRVERTCGARRRGDCTVTQSRVAVEVYRSARRLGLAHNRAKGSTANLCSESLSGRLHMQPHPHPQHALNLCSLGLLVRACAPALAKPFPTKRILHVNSAENSMEQMPLCASAEKVLRPPLRLNLNFPPSTPVPKGTACTAATVERRWAGRMRSDSSRHCREEGGDGEPRRAPPGAAPRRRGWPDVCARAQMSERRRASERGRKRT